MNPSDAPASAIQTQPIPGGAAGQGRRVSFVVPGRARPQGSKRAFVRPDGGVSMVEQVGAVKEWRARVSGFAATAWGDKAPSAQPVRIACVFVFRRPKSHYGTGKKAHILRHDAPRVPASRAQGDLEKLLRALFDALCGVLIVDDSQVVGVAADKVYATPDSFECAEIDVVEVGG